MKIAITDLKDYNEAILRFEWLDLEQYSSADEIGEYIEEFLSKRSKQTGELHEEWFVTDYEEFVDLGEYPNLETMEEAIKLSKQYGYESVSAYYGLSQTLEGFEDAYCGEYESEEDFAYELVQDCYNLKNWEGLEIYFDYEKFARDLFINDYSSEKIENHKMVVFKMI